MNAYQEAVLGPPGWPVRRREPDEWPAEQDLILKRARRGGLAWTRPIERRDLLDSPWRAFNNALDGRQLQRWALDDPAQAGRLLGSLWVEWNGWRRCRLSLFLDPALSDPDGRQALLLHALSALDLPHYRLRVETTANDPPVEAILQAGGFHVTRELVQMWRDL
mgnify:CR=1 FL=1